MMSRLRITRRSVRRLRVACAGLVIVTAGVSVSACNGSSEAADPYGADTASHDEPATLEPIKGTDVMSVTFTTEGARRVGLQTAPIREEGRGKVIPYAAIIYDPEGKTYTYTSPEPLTFVRREVEIDRVDGDSVLLSDGPPAGTEVVTVGAAEVYGTEFEVSN